MTERSSILWPVSIGALTGALLALRGGAPESSDPEPPLRPVAARPAEPEPAEPAPNPSTTAEERRAAERAPADRLPASTPAEPAPASPPARGPRSAIPVTAPATTTALRPPETRGQAQAAELGCYEKNPNDCERAAIAYQRGEVVPKNEKLAERLRMIALTFYVRHCESGRAQSCIRLAELNEAGELVHEPSSYNARGLRERAAELCRMKPSEPGCKQLGGGGRGGDR